MENNICRACLTQISQGYPIFDFFGNELTLAAILNRFLQTKIVEDFRFPYLFCESCTECLVQFHNFINIYEQSEKTLHNQLNDEILHVEREVKVDIKDELHVESEVKVDINDDKIFVVEESSDFIENCKEDLSRKDSLQCEDVKNLKHNKTIDYKSLKWHKDVINKKKPRQTFVCDICGKVCSKEFDLKDHMDSHSNKLNYSCKICNKRLKCRTSLTRHLKAHSHQNQFMCELCGRKFTHISTLRTHHYLLHVKEKMFQCVICDQSFSRKATLQKHVKRHQQRETECERKHKCSLCDMKYLDKSSLRRHVEIKHCSENTLQCSLCDVKFGSKSNLINHKKRNHFNVVLIEETRDLL